MSDDPLIRSRLAGRAGGQPLRGMGSGFAQNQRMAGVQNPEEAARLAAMSPEELAAKQRLDAERVAKAESQAQEIFEAMQGGWKPLGYEGSIDPASWLKQVVAAGQLESVYQDLQKVQEAEFEQTEAEVAENLLGSMRIEPDDPLYNPLTDKQRRKAIEAKLKPLDDDDFNEMVFRGYCEQDIETRPGFVVTMRSLYTRHGEWLEAHLATLPESTVQHFRHMTSLVQIACAVERINGKPIGTDISRITRHDQKKEFLEALQVRMDFIGRLPGPLSDDLIVQYTWFTGRVRKLLTGDILGKVGNS